MLQYLNLKGEQLFEQSKQKNLKIDEEQALRLNNVFNGLLTQAAGFSVAFVLIIFSIYGFMNFSDKSVFFVTSFFSIYFLALAYSGYTLWKKNKF